MVMRRLWATLLLAVIGFALIGPALLAASADTNLPACCRRDGKHHCATPASSNGPSIQPVRCASFPVGNPATAPRGAAVLDPQPVIFADLPHEGAARCEVQ